MPMRPSEVLPGAELLPVAPTLSRVASDRMASEPKMPMSRPTLTVPNSLVPAVTNTWQKSMPAVPRPTGLPPPLALNGVPWLELSMPG